VLTHLQLLESQPIRVEMLSAAVNEQEFQLMARPKVEAIIVGLLQIMSVNTYITQK